MSAKAQKQIQKISLESFDDKGEFYPPVKSKLSGNSQLSAECELYPFAFVSSEEFYLESH